MDPITAIVILSILATVIIVTFLVTRSRTKEQSQQASTVSAQGLSAVGDITINQYVTGEGSISDQLEFFRNEIGFEERRNELYDEGRFEAYSDVWRSLQKLRLAGDDLWDSATEENLIVFTNALRQTTGRVREGEVFFEEADRQSLLNVLGKFGNYEMGKEYLIDISSSESIHQYPERDLEAEIKQQIQDNQRYKLKYEQILERIRKSFNKQLAG